MPSKHEWNFMGDALKVGAAGLLAHSQMTAAQAREENMLRLRAERNAVEDTRYEQGRTDKLAQQKISNQQHKDEVAARASDRQATADYRTKSLDAKTNKPNSPIGGLMADRDALPEDDVENRAAYDLIIKSKQSTSSGARSSDMQLIGYFSANNPDASHEDILQKVKNFKKDPDEMAIKLAMEIRKNQDDPYFPGDKMSNEDIAKEARGFVAQFKKEKKPAPKPTPAPAPKVGDGTELSPAEKALKNDPTLADQYKARFGSLPDWFKPKN